MNQHQLDTSFLVCLLGFNASTCFGRYSPIFRRLCTDDIWCIYVRRMFVNYSNDGGSRVLWNVGTCLSKWTRSQPIRQLRSGFRSLHTPVSAVSFCRTLWRDSCEAASGSEQRARPSCRMSWHFKDSLVHDKGFRKTAVTTHIVRDGQLARIWTEQEKFK
jgi:hypothetical protein